MRKGIEVRLQEAENYFAHRIAGVHRLSDAELAGLIAWLKSPDPDLEEWAISVLERERLLP